MPTGIWLASFFGMLALLLFETFLVMGMLKQLSSLYIYHVKNDPDAGLTLGMRAPLMESADVFSGAALSTRSTGTKKMLFFFSTKCDACRQIMPIIPLLAGAEDLDVIAIFTAPPQAVKLYFAEKWRTIENFEFGVIADTKSSYSDKFKIPYVPYVVVIDEDGFIGAKGMPLSAGEAYTLLRQADALRKNRLKNQAPIGIPQGVA